MGGEQEKAWPLMVALTRKKGEKEQRIIVSGDTDWCSVGGLTIPVNGIESGNFEFMMDMFHYLCEGEFPMDLSRPLPLDDRLFLEQSAEIWIRWFFEGAIPFSLLWLAWGIRWRRKRR